MSMLIEVEVAEVIVELIGEVSEEYFQTKQT
jgi:hypothetical protein